MFDELVVAHCIVLLLPEMEKKEIHKVFFSLWQLARRGGRKCLGVIPEEEEEEEEEEDEEEEDEEEEEERWVVSQGSKRRRMLRLSSKRETESAGKRVQR